MVWMQYAALLFCLLCFSAVYDTNVHLLLQCSDRTARLYLNLLQLLFDVRRVCAPQLHIAPPVQSW
jgi:hypothetical protein